MLDYLALKIAQAWNREPNWFYTLPRAEQIKVMAAYRIDMMPPEQRRKKSKGDKKALIKQKIQEYANRDRVKHGN